MPEFVHTTIDNQIATVTLDRPDLHNAFNEVVMRELTDSFDALGRDDSVRAIVLRATGRSFCAGADVNWMKRMVDYSFEENVADSNVFAQMLRTIRDCPKPSIARVHGACIGGGVGLVAACDMSVAIEKAKFSLSEVKLGIVPAMISPFVMEKLGPGTTRRLALTAERFDGVEAMRVGLVSQAVATEAELDDWVAGKCEQIKGNGPLALVNCKEILTEVGAMMWDELQQKTAERISRVRVSPEGQEGLKAFLEKRKPNWVTEKE